MNIFVLNAGRSGSMTFIEACKHITNYVCAHESRCAMLGRERFNYPKNHIEADNRLSWLLGRLDKRYGDSAFYVHLKRNNDDTARSFSKRFSKGIIRAYRGDGILLGLPEDSDPESVSLDYCNTVSSNIECFLKDKTQKITIRLESIEKDFAEFWEMINAEGDIHAALREFNNRYNATKKPQEENERALVPRISGKLRKLGTKFALIIKNT